MMRYMKTIFRNYIRANKWIVLFMSILFLTGVVFGAIIVNSMSFVQKEDVFFHLQQYFTLVKENKEIDHWELFRRSYFFHVKYLFILFILGMTIIGLPIIWVLLFMKGLIVGFSVGFIVHQLGWKGLGLATLSVAPQNMITVPTYILASTVSVHFAIMLWKKLWGRNNKVSPIQLVRMYATVFLFFFISAFISSGVETFISNQLFQYFLKIFMTIL